MPKENSKCKTIHGMMPPWPRLIKHLADKSDYGFEMSVGQVLKASAAEVDHGGTYSDVAKGIPRQFDYRAVWEQGDFIVQIAAECKNFSPMSPVVICGGKRTERESFHHFVASTHGVLKSNTVGGNIDRCDTLLVKPSPLYPVGDFVGKSVFRPERERRHDRLADAVDGFTIGGDGEVYDGSTQSISSAAEMCSSAMAFHKTRRKKFAFTITLPVVVVPDNVVWKMAFGENCKPAGDPQTTEHCTLFRGQDVQLETTYGARPVRLSHVHIVTINGLVELIRKLEGPGSPIWVQWFPESVRNLFISRFA